MRKTRVANKCRMLAAGVSLSLGLSGCGAKEPKLQIRIFDCQTETRAEIQAGITVEEALAQAEVPIREEDAASPELGEIITGEGMEITVKRHAEVTVTEDDKGKDMEFLGGQVKDAMDAAGIQLGKNDTINHDLEAYLVNGMEIQVVHRHLVEIDVDGRRTEYLTTADTVTELLQEQNIHLDPRDQIAPKLETELKDHMKVVIHRVSVKQVSEFQEIPFDTKVEYTSSMFEGETQKKQQGHNGEMELVYEVTYVDGKEESRNLVEEKVVEEPVSSIILKGTAPRRRIVSREAVYDCDGSGHGYYIITWSDGVVEYQDF